MLNGLFTATAYISAPGDAELMHKMKDTIDNQRDAIRSKNMEIDGLRNDLEAVRYSHKPCVTRVTSLSKRSRAVRLASSRESRKRMNRESRPQRYGVGWSGISAQFIANLKCQTIWVDSPQLLNWTENTAGKAVEKLSADHTGGGGGTLCVCSSSIARVSRVMPGRYTKNLT